MAQHPGKEFGFDRIQRFLAALALATPGEMLRLYRETKAMPNFDQEILLPIVFSHSLELDPKDLIVAMRKDERDEDLQTAFAG